MAYIELSAQITQIKIIRWVIGLQDVCCPFRRRQAGRNAVGVSRTVWGNAQRGR